jgi:phospholipase C
MTMSYFTGDDVPFHHALARSFTVCDNYFCSIQGPTTPNRLFHWTGTIDPAGTAGGPAIDNPADYNPVYSWKTYPERLQEAGISWQVYANDEIGDDGAHPYVGDYGDNPLWLFQAYHDALAASDPKARQLAERASLRAAWKPDAGLGENVDHVIAQFAADCQAGTLPAVSWVVAPYGYSEHPAARPVDGEAYVQGVLNSLWKNPKLWESTVVFINYDENDGFFDHVTPPVAPPGTAQEYVGGIPVGLGPRVPMSVISPWSRGGWVNSEVFDHTSVLRFLEKWTGVAEPNISAWRRAITGDLTGCFDFTRPNRTLPLLPDTAALRTQADNLDPTLPDPAPPVVGRQAIPEQDAGTAPARALPYQPVADLEVTSGTVRVRMGNSGSGALQLAVYSLAGPAQRFDLPPGGGAEGAVELEAVTGAYDVWVHGPNGFLRRASGDAATSRLGVEVALEIVGRESHPSLRLRLRNSGGSTVTAEVAGRGCRRQSVRIGRRYSLSLDLDPIRAENGWYDISVTLAGEAGYRRRFAGHLENGEPSRTA